MGNISGKQPHMFARHLEGAVLRVLKFSGFLPLLGGLRFPVVGGLNIALSAATTYEIVRWNAYFSGPQQIVNNNGANAITVHLWDGKPGETDSVKLHTIVVAASQTGIIDLAGTVLLTRHNPWLEVAGTAPDGEARLKINY